MAEKKSPAKKKATVPAVKVQNALSEPDVQSHFPIVGIGASAGGLAAFEKFFANMPADTESGMAFVLVQHLAPDHKSILSDLIKRYTAMRVYEASDGIKVQPNCTYIIPPNRDIALLHGQLYLNEPVVSRGLRLPIDSFFRSLAQDQHERAICIVLSGTGSDGMSGLKAIKGEGGMAMAQTPESTEYEGMPRNAIATGMVDYVLPPEEMPAKLIAYVKIAFAHKLNISSPKSIKTDDQLKKIFILLRAKTGHDFSYYKESTVKRRIERRLAVNQIKQIEDYIKYLQQKPLEVEALFRDLLIGVTSFFRDTEAFNVLKEKVLPRLFDGIGPDGQIRIWVPGCSTGEEPYSIAMLLQEVMETRKQNYKIHIFATDIDSQAIGMARTGRYLASIAADVSPERLARFFTQQTAGTYQIHKFIRDMMVFSEQDMIRDPPFSKLDMISCRNLLIYMRTELQKKVVSLFHYALNPDGYLLLGNSESIGDFVDLFAIVDTKWKLYQRRKDVFPRPPIGGPALPLKEGTLPGAAREMPKESKITIRALTERALLQQYAPSSVVINKRGEILYIHGSTGKYLEPARGEISVDIVRMAREGLRHELTAAIRKVITGKGPVCYPGLRVKTNGEITLVNLTVKPVTEDTGDPQGLLLVTFQDVPPPGEKDKPDVVAVETLSTGSDEKVRALERELQDKEEYLRTTVEELETSNEELTSTNEELQSANEELQSTNEELETSSEELQSVNEELSTVNTEMQQTMDQLNKTSNDMHNLLVATGMGAIFLDRNLCIKFFTPAAVDVFNFIQNDIGRPVGHIVSKLAGYSSLVEDIQVVLRSLIPRDIQVQTKEHVWYLLRILPYRTLENVIDGAVITLVDISESKQAEKLLQGVNSLRRLAVVVRDSNDAVSVSDLQGRILAWNPSAERIYGWSESEALTMNISATVPKGQRKKELATIKKLARGVIIEPLQTKRLTKSGKIIDIRLTATALVNESGEIYAIATTERKEGR